MSEEGLKVEIPAQGWKQFLTGRQEILDGYDRARSQSRGHEVETFHGNVGEAEFRRWLIGFLPKRYGVTSGYVISQGLPDQKFPHFDVIIYDALNSPILWVEGNPDASHAGRSMAVPAEYVLGVLEVKSALTAQSARSAISHLRDLSSLMQGVDEPNEKYRLYLPRTFFCGVVFLEIRKADEYSETSMNALLEGVDLRGFLGGIVLRGEGHDLPFSGRIGIFPDDGVSESNINAEDKTLLKSGARSASILRVRGGCYFGLILWYEAVFAQYAFDLVAILQGTYEPGRLSAFHGFGSSTAFESF